MEPDLRTGAESGSGIRSRNLDLQLQGAVAARIIYGSPTLSRYLICLIVYERVLFLPVWLVCLPYGDEPIYLDVYFIHWPLGETRVREQSETHQKDHSGGYLFCTGYSFCQDVIYLFFDLITFHDNRSFVFAVPALFHAEAKLPFCFFFSFHCNLVQSCGSGSGWIRNF